MIVITSSLILIIALSLWVWAEKRDANMWEKCYQGKVREFSEYIAQTRKREVRNKKICKNVEDILTETQKELSCVDFE
jgi:hypothetical protein